MNLLKYKDKLLLKSENDKRLVFDIVRKKYIVLTPEELVRQLYLHFLIEELNIPLKHIAVERGININNKQFRFDILVFNKEGNPKLIVECKSHKIELTEAVAIQASKYNIALRAKYLSVTNGIETRFYEIDYKKETINKLDQLSLNKISNL